MLVLVPMVMMPLPMLVLMTVLMLFPMSMLMAMFVVMTVLLPTIAVAMTRRVLVVPPLLDALAVVLKPGLSTFFFGRFIGRSRKSEAAGPDKNGCRKGRKTGNKLAWQPFLGW